MFATRGPIDVTRLLAEVQDSGRGGTTVFLGSVRSGEEDGGVVAIEYSAYEPMLEAEFGRIVGEAEAQWAGCRVRAIHRLGLVPLGETSIAVAAAAPHRTAAFEACRYVIEEAKRRLPVWKKERLTGGVARWREG